MKHLILLCVAAVATGASSLAQAETLTPMPKTPNYAGFSLGIDHSDTLDALKRSDNLYHTRTTPVAFRMELGRHWGPVWGTELSYTNFGRTSFKAASGSGSDESGSVSAYGFALTSVWRLRTEENFTWATRLGLALSQSRGLATSSTYPSIDEAWSAWGLTYGLGLEHPTTDGWRIQVRADATQIKVSDRRELAKVYALGLTKAF